MRQVGNALFLTVDMLIIVGVAVATSAMGPEYPAVAVSVIGLMLVVLFPTGLLVSPLFSVIVTTIAAGGFVTAVLLSGVDLTRTIRDRFPDTQVLVLTAYDSEHLLLGAIEAGAVGYILKDEPMDGLVHAVSRAAVIHAIAHRVFSLEEV